MVGKRNCFNSLVFNTKPKLDEGWFLKDWLHCESETISINLSYSYTG